MPEQELNNKKPVDPVTEAMYHDVALLALAGGITRQEIAQRVGVSDRVLRRVMQRPEFIEIFRTKQNELYGDLERVLRDERLDPLTRAAALERRGQTLITEIIDVMRSRIDEHQDEGRRLSALEMRAVVDAAKVAMSAATDKQRARGATQMNVAVFSPSPDQARTIRNAADEADIDMSDIMDAVLVEGPDNEGPQEVPDEPKDDDPVPGGDSRRDPQDADPPRGLPPGEPERREGDDRSDDVDSTAPHSDLQEETCE